MNARTAITPTDAELRQQYERTGLYRIGMTFERAMQIDAVALSMRVAIQCRWRREAEQAKRAAINYQVKEAA